MASEVTIIRDAYGVAHVFAESEVGAAFGQGWAQAEDRLEAVLRNIKQARGELAEIDGADALERDVRTRAFRLAELAREGYDEQISPEMRAVIEAFCAGINRYQEAYPQRRPDWAFVVTPEDVAAFALFVNLFFANDPAERLPVSIDGGSNAFAVAAEKTESGRGSIVSIDPHLPWHGFMRWHEAHLCGGALNVCGITFAGLPLIVAGHNGRVAWARTVNAPDLSDLYEERLVIENGVPTAYEYDGERRPLTTRQFTFRVRQADGATTHRTQTIHYTHHGPLLIPGADARTAYAVRKAGWGDLGLFDEIRAQCLAQSAEEYRKSLAGRRVVMFNHVFGDDAGRIGYVWAGRIPTRPWGFDFRGPVPGWTSATEWGGPVPFGALPQAMDAPQGFLQNCNDSPFVCGAGESLKPSPNPADYPEWLAPDIRTLRGSRQTHLLKAAGPISVDEAMAITTDVLDLHAAHELDALLDAARHVQVSSEEDRALLAECVRVLSAWDRRLTADARGAALFQMWLWDARIQPLAGGFMERGLPPVAEGPGQDAAVAALLQAARTLRGHIDILWGAVHRHGRGDVDIPMDGGGESLVPNFGMPGVDGRMTCSFGSSFRMLVELGNGPVCAWSVSPYGVSDDPASPHYADQMPLAAARRYRRVPWTRDDVEREATDHIQIAYSE